MTDEVLSPRRKWLAITVATVVMTVSYSAIVAAMVAAAADDGPDPSPLFALGLGLVPFVFVALAFLSRHPRAPGAVLRAMGLSVVVALIVAGILRDAASGLVAGFGAGGIVSLRAEDVHNWKARTVAVVISTSYVAILIYVSVETALLAGAILPFLSIGIADWVSEHRARSREPDPS